MVVVLVVGYGVFRVVRHFAFPARATAPVCLRRPTTPIEAHPIVAFGDSITWGYDASNNCVALSAVRDPAPRLHRPGPDDTTYPADLTRLQRSMVLDYGVPDETTAGGLRRLPAVLAATHPRAVILLEGVNDLVAGASPRTLPRELPAWFTWPGRHASSSSRSCRPISTAIPYPSRRLT